MTFKQTQQGTQDSFLMDETLETVPAGQEIKKLDILKPYKPGEVVELDDKVILAAPVDDNEIAVLEAIAIDLQDLELQIKSGGMSQSIANEMLRHIPEFIDDVRPMGMFTKAKTSSGANEALEAIEDSKSSLAEKFKALVSKAGDEITSKVEWIKNKLFPTKAKAEEELALISENAKPKFTDAVNQIKILAVSHAKSEEVEKDLKNFNEGKYAKLVADKYSLDKKDQQVSIDCLFMHNLSKTASTMVKYHDLLEQCVKDLNDESQIETAAAASLEKLYVEIRDISLTEANEEVVTAGVYKNLLTDSIVANLKKIDDKSDTLVIVNKKPQNTDALKSVNLVMTHIQNLFRFMGEYTRGINTFVSIYNKYLNHTNESGVKEFTKLCMKKEA